MLTVTREIRKTLRESGVATKGDINMTKVVANQEYVYGRTDSKDNSLIPCQCNSQYSPEHPCRVIPVKVGPKWSYALLSGSKKPQKIMTEGLVPVDEAKARYRLGLERLKRDPRFIDQCVASL